jgi:hypothetical protein
MRFGKSSDLLFSFCMSKFFPWPAALYLIFKNDAEFSFFQAPFDVFGKCIQTPILINSKAIGCTHICSPKIVHLFLFYGRGPRLIQIHLMCAVYMDAVRIRQA